RNCACAPCKYDRSMGCNKPYACQEQARQLLGALDPKWNLSLEIVLSNPPYSPVTPDEILENEDAFADKQATTFNPNIFVADHLASALRVFVDEPTSRIRFEQMNCEEDASDLTLYIAGTSEVDCDGEYRAAGGIWINNDHPKNVGVCVPDGHVTRTSGTLAAMLYAIQSTANSTPMNFVLDSKDMVKKLTLGLPTLEANGYTGDQDKKLLWVIVAALRTRSMHTSFRQANNCHDTVPIC
ncbi:hypothetical protein C8F01DRAFT_971268, partial [Mycena amicta]